jgi:mannosyltransferase
MRSPGDWTVLTQPPRAAQRPARPGGAGGSTPGDPLWMRIAAPLLTLAVTAWRINGSSYWRDESATLVAVSRPVGNLLRLLAHVDAVHGAYYLIMWPLVRLAGTGEVATRLPSALAMAAAAALVVAIGRRLVSPVAGLAAGLVFAAIPVVSVYAQDARSYALVTALGAAASYLLVRVIGAPGRYRGWLAGYAVCLAAMGVLNIFGLLLIPAHAVTVAVEGRRRPPGRARWSLTLGWLAAAAGAAAVTSPVVLLAWAERSQLAWLVAPGQKTIASLGQFAGTGKMPAAIGITLACAVAASALAGRAALRAGWPPLLLTLAVPWLVLPPALLLAASQITPLYTLRYVVFCGPAGALLAGAGLAAAGRAVSTGLGWTTGTGLGRRAAAAATWMRARPDAKTSTGRPARTGRPASTGRAACIGLAGLGWATATAALLVIAMLGLTAQARIRSPAGHVDNIRAADRIIAARMRPGDAAIFTTPANENLQAAYPYGMARLRNIALYQTPIESATLAGTALPPAVVRQRIQSVPRLWVIQVHHDKRLPILQGLGLQLIGRWHPRDLWLLLYAQRRS